MGIIHISSGQMTALPDYNIMLKNTIKNISMNEYNVNINLYNNSIFTVNIPYSQDNILLKDDISGSFERYAYGTHDVDYKTGVNDTIVTKNVNCIGLLFKLNINGISNFSPVSQNSKFSIVKNYTYEYVNNSSSTTLTEQRTSQTTSNYNVSDIYTFPENISYDDFDLTSALSNNSLYANKLYLFLGSQNNNTVGCFIILDATNYLTYDDNSGYKYYKKAYSIQSISVIPQFEEYILSNSQEEQGTDYSYPSNKLLQNTATRDNISLPTYIRDSIISKWGNGRQTMSLTCIYGKYYSYDASTLSKDSTEVVLNGTDGKIIEVGDIVVPTRLYTNQITNSNYELPIAVDKDGNALEFEVLSSEIEFSNGRLVTHLKLMEVK